MAKTFIALEKLSVATAAAGNCPQLKVQRNDVEV